MAGTLQHDPHRHGHAEGQPTANTPGRQRRRRPGRCDLQRHPAADRIKVTLTDYRIRAVTKGKEAMGEVQIELEHNGRKIRGRGLSTDILEASALAYLAAINRLRSLATTASGW
jgi:hypothetical protein